MDVPISLAILIAPAMSLVETIRGGPHVYFDSALTLLFFLLIGRFLDARARGAARGAAARLLALGAASVTVVGEDGATRRMQPDQLAVGDELLVAAGERIGADGAVLSGRSELDTSLITGESAPAAVVPGDAVFAGTVNVASPLRVRVRAVGEGTLLAEIVRLMEAAEQRRGRFVAIADRAARLYAPFVHTLAAATFLGWWLALGAPWQTALLYAVAVLIVTCPCALGLAVPAVQVIASGRLMRRGTFLKSATALERFADVDTVVFDKTGTLTEGRLELIREGIDPVALEAAASLAKASRHPLARAIAATRAGAPALSGVEEVPGCGLRICRADGEWRLGRRDWATRASGRRAPGCRALAQPTGRGARALPASRIACGPTRASVIAELKRRGLDVRLLSGDRATTVREVAQRARDRALAGGGDPEREGAARSRRWRGEGRRVLMVGDGLNDAPALAAAHVSLSPATAADVEPDGGRCRVPGPGAGTGRSRS